MWLKFEVEELLLLRELLLKSGLNGMLSIIDEQLLGHHPTNNTWVNKNAVDAARTYFSCDDLSIDERVKWDEEGNAHVMAWQKVPSIFITKGKDCGCGH